MREDVEQKSNDQHPVRWHWRVGQWGNSHTGSLQLSDPSPATSSRLLCCCRSDSGCSDSGCSDSGCSDGRYSTKLAKLNRARSWSDVQVVAILLVPLTCRVPVGVDLCGSRGGGRKTRLSKKSLCGELLSDRAQPPECALVSQLRSSTVVRRSSDRLRAERLRGASALG